MGFVPSSLRVMARVPGLLDGMTGLSSVVFLNDLLPVPFKQLIGFMASAGAGCRYCQAHTAAHAAHLGVDEQKLADLWSFETSDRFTDAERAALRLALHSGPVAQRGDRCGLRRVPAALHRRADHRDRRGVRAVRLPQPVERDHGDDARSRAPRRRRRTCSPRRAGPSGSTHDRAPADDRHPHRYGRAAAGAGPRRAGDPRAVRRRRAAVRRRPRDGAAAHRGRLSTRTRSPRCSSPTCTATTSSPSPTSCSPGGSSTQLHRSGPLPVVVPEGSAARFVRRVLDAYDDDIALRIAHVQPEPPDVDLRTCSTRRPNRPRSGRPTTAR